MNFEQQPAEAVENSEMLNRGEGNPHLSEEKRSEKPSRLRKIISYLRAPARASSENPTDTMDQLAAQLESLKEKKDDLMKYAGTDAWVMKDRELLEQLEAQIAELEERSRSKQAA